MLSQPFKRRWTKQISVLGKLGQKLTSNGACNWVHVWMVISYKDMSTQLANALQLKIWVVAGNTRFDMQQINQQSKKDPSQSTALV